MTEVVWGEPAARLRYEERAQIPAWVASYGLDSLPAAAAKVCEMFVANCTAGDESARPGLGIIFSGPPGTGKTTAAVSALRAVLQSAPREWLGKHPGCDAMRPGFYISYAKFIRTWKKTFGEYADGPQAQELMDSLHFEHAKPWWNTRVLVLDDVGKEQGLGKDFSQRALHDILRSRYDEGAPTIITTNLTADGDWVNYYGPATADFVREAYLPVPMVGKSHRGR